MLADFSLSRSQRALVARLADVVCPPEMATLGIRDEVIEETELMMRALPAYLRLGLLAGMKTFDEGARVYPGARGSKFSSLADEAVADRYFSFWAHSKNAIQHQFAKGIKGLICFSYYENPKVRAMLRLDAEGWVAQVARRRLETYAEDIRSAEEEVIR